MYKKLKISSLLLCFIILSCSSLNEFGVRRNKVSLERIKPNNNDDVYKIIDTSKIYKLHNIVCQTDEIVGNDLNGMNERNPSYLKFYKNGRVGEFRNIDLSDIKTLNPKKAESHLYSFKNNKFIVQEYFKHPQCGECFVKKILTKNSQNQIVLSSENYTYTYAEVDIPLNYLIYKPDW